jgi:hypothetical protein
MAIEDAGREVSEMMRARAVSPLERVRTARIRREGERRAKWMADSSCE